MTCGTSNTITDDCNTKLHIYMEVIVIVIIFTFNQGHTLISRVTFLYAVKDATTSAILTRLDVALVATAMPQMQ